MEWLPVMTLPDGTTVEMPIPPPERTGQGSEAAYRVRGSAGVTEFATMPEVLHHLAASGAGTLEGSPTASSAASAPARERVQSLRAPAGRSPSPIHDARGKH